MLAIAIPAYVVGGVNGAIITSISVYRKDIRRYGSGNPGLTNFYRVFGKGFALLVIVIDVMKSVAPVLLGGWLCAHFLLAGQRMFGRELAGFFVMLGHCFPLFYRFMGGKGVMALGTVLFIIDWRIALLGWGVFALTALLTRYVSLGAILGSLAYPAAVVVFDLGGIPEFLIALACAVLLIARHHENIRRLIAGKESKFSFSRSKRS
ncbi:MAG: glycerol-3-phosphate 1-O-acyltransferase PlsY [Oscillospiraceae bacterium]|jgi:glycerol-3-phosphate acyltransferase PlsY|nr:glycerol-3-phosphate 1-O-acyltransferase PlsY [Oscillospiraceae bacterium]